VLRARARRAEVENSRRETQRRFQATLASIDKREDAVRKSQNRLGAEQKKIDRPASNTSNRQRNLNARATVFATYDEPPLEMEKARILASLK
jgi:flagellin-like hook-associated protein FlgL